ncbi:hypothetical protein [Alteriqipengyuania sp. 357]
MRTEARLAAMAILAVAAPAGPPACESFAGAFCADAGSADHGLIVTSDATIEFETGAQGLRLTVDDTRTGAQTVLDLPYGTRQEAARPAHR